MEWIKKAPETMTSRERVQRTFAYDRPDRVTISYKANDAVHQRLCQTMGVTEGQQYELLKALGVDYLDVVPKYIGPKLFPDFPDRLVHPETGWRKKALVNEYGKYYDYCDYPLLGASEEKIAAYPSPNPDDYDYEDADRQIEMLLDKGFSVHIGDTGMGDILNTTGVLMGFENSLVNLMSEDEATLEMTDRRLNSRLEVSARILERNKGKIDFMWLGEDLGTQIAPMISMEMYKRVLAPRHQKFIDLAKAYNIPAIIHTCGSSSWVYEEFIRMGMSGVDTLQPEAKDMSPQYLVQQFGGRLNFRGCISTAGCLSTGTPEQIAQECCTILELMKGCGGYHFAPTHKLQNNTPVENILAMYQAAHTYGRYL